MKPSCKEQFIRLPRNSSWPIVLAMAFGAVAVFHSFATEVNPEAACSRSLESSVVGAPNDTREFAGASWHLLRVGNTPETDHNKRPDSRMADVIAAHRSQLNEMIGYELFKIWQRAGGNADAAFRAETKQLVGIEPEHVMDRAYQAGFEGISPGAPLNAFQMKMKGVRSDENPSEPGYIYFEASVTFNAENILSISSEMRHFTSVTYRWRVRIKKDQLQNIMKEIPVTAIANKAQRSQTYVMDQVSVEVLRNQANQDEFYQKDMPLLSKLVADGANPDVIVGVAEQSIGVVQLHVRINADLRKDGAEVGTAKYVLADFDWTKNQLLAEQEITKEEYEFLISRDGAKVGVSIGQGVVIEAMSPPVTMSPSIATSTDVPSGTTATAEVASPALNSLVSPLSASAYAIVARPDHMLYSPRSARGVMEALLDEVRRLAADPPESMKRLDFGKLLRDVKHDPRIFGYQDFPGGEVTLGSPPDESGRMPDREGDKDKNKNDQRIKRTVDPFEMGNHMPQWVVDLWRFIHNKVKGFNSNNEIVNVLPNFRGKEHNDGDYIDLGTFDDYGITMNANHPAENISWNEAQEFLKWFNELPGIKASGCRYELPSSTQWEYVSRYLGINPVDGKPRFSSGARPFTEDQLSNFAIYDANSRSRTHAIGTKWPFPGSGLSDVLGNTFVWTKDQCGSEDRSLSAIPNHINPVVEVGPDRVFRGGCWLFDAGSLRSALRDFASPDHRYGNVGLRLIRTCAQGAQ